ncbi:hypothetical protein BDW72DRAFT_212587 [Aspergillus terricola var. indicus]
MLRNVIQCTNRYGHQTSTRLGDLVEGVHRLSHIGKLRALLDLVADRDMEFSAKESLLNIVSKVARYRDSARFLYRTAKKVPVARRMNAICVKLPREAFDHSLARKYTPDILLTPSRIDQQYSQKASNQVWRLLSTTREEASRQFSSQVRKTLEAKIHTEFQLITYCELKMPRFKPRVICSSKDACFLCRSFIHMHGKLHIPRSHGRLYPCWRLPLLPTLYPFPIESTLLTLAISETTRHSSEQPERIAQASSPQILKTNNRSTLSTGMKTSCVSAQCSNHERPCTGYSTTRSFSFSGHSAFTAHSRLSNSLDLGAQSPQYNAESLWIRLEYPTGSRNIGYSVEWLLDKGAIRIQNERNLVPVIDADALASELSLHDQNCVYIVAKKATKPTRR